jgi:hypothetical protein
MLSWNFTATSQVREGPKIISQKKKSKKTDDLVVCWKVKEVKNAKSSQIFTIEASSI